MEDIQDGKKVSIQDGVTEDPTLPEEFTALTGSGTSKNYLATKLSEPEIKGSVRGEIGATAIVGAISSSVAGVIT